MKIKTFNLFAVYVLLSFFSIITLIPFAWMVCAAFKGNADFFSAIFLPSGDGFLGVAWERLSLENFRKLYLELDLLRAFANSCFLSSVTAILCTLTAAMGGYALAKFQFRGSNFMVGLVLVALIIPGPLLIAPSYQWIYQLGLLNSYGSLILPALGPAFGVYLFRQATLQSVPTELLEAARIDGASEFRIFFSIALPMLRPMIGAFIMITFLAVWNNFIGPQIMLQSPDMLPLSVAVNQLKGLYSQDYGMLMAGTLVSIAPVLVLFLLLQKEFIAGLTAGSVKG